MADVKISQLTALASASSDVAADVLAIVDTSVPQTKKITIENLVAPITLDKSNSRIGIGTSSPAQILDVQGGRTHLKSNDEYNLRLYASNGDSGKFIGTPAGDKLNIYSDVGNAEVTVDASGNVGIGTDSPNISGWNTNYAVLTIKGDTTNYGGVLELANPDSTGNYFGTVQFVNMDGGSSTVANARISGTRDGADDASALAFETEPTGGDVTERMRITSDGKVGIGTASPLTNFDVRNTTQTIALNTSAGAVFESAPSLANNGNYLFGNGGSGSDTPQILAVNSDSTPAAGNWAGIGFGVYYATSSNTVVTLAGIAGIKEDATDGSGGDNGALAFGTRPNGDYIKERMRIKSDGALTLIEKGNAIANSLRFQGLETVGDDEAQNYTMDGTCCIVILANHSSDDAALFFMSYASATITKIADPSNEYDTSATDGKSCIYKSSNSSTFTIENKRGGARNMGIGQIAVTSTV